MAKTMFKTTYRTIFFFTKIEWIWDFLFLHTRISINFCFRFIWQFVGWQKKREIEYVDTSYRMRHFSRVTLVVVSIRSSLFSFLSFSSFAVYDSNSFGSHRVSYLPRGVYASEEKWRLIDTPRSKAVRLLFFHRFFARNPSGREKNKEHEDKNLLQKFRFPSP